MPTQWITSLWNFVQTAGTPGLLFVGLFFALYGNYKGWWVSGREYKAQTGRCDKFEKLYDDASELLKTTVTATQDSNANLRAQVDLLERLLPPRRGGPGVPP